MSPSLEKERIDHQILNPIFSGTEPDRDTLAEYQIHLAAFFCISVPECLGRCVGKHPEKLWVKIPNYFCLSTYPVVQDVHMLIALVILLGHLLVDVAYVSLQLHVRHQSIVGLIACGAVVMKGCL